MPHVQPQPSMYQCILERRTPIAANALSIKESSASAHWLSEGTAVSFLEASVAHYKALGVTIKRLITDNGAIYGSKLFAHACQTLGIKHTFKRPYLP